MVQHLEQACTRIPFFTALARQPRAPYNVPINKSQLSQSLLPMRAAIRSTEPATIHAAPEPLADPLVTALAQRGLLTPALLFVAGHRPLAFAAGQLLALAAPLAAVLGAPQPMHWAHALSTPEGVNRLQAALAGEADQERKP